MQCVCSSWLQNSTENSGKNSPRNELRQKLHFWLRLVDRTMRAWIDCSLCERGKRLFCIKVALNSLTNNKWQFQQVETRGLTERGIYRVSGSEKEVKALKDRFLLSNDVPDLSNVDMHVICGCIKIFLRGLREPLIPTWQWHVFSNAVVEFDGDSIDGNILKKLQFAISRLPKANRDTLAFLVLHLQR